MRHSTMKIALRNPINTAMSLRYKFPAAIFFFIILLIHTSLTSAQYSFTTYPESAQSCGTYAYDLSDCGYYTTEYDVNSCLCSNSGDFIEYFAQCVGAKDASDLTNVFNTLSHNCEVTNTPVVGSLNQFLEAAGVNTNTLVTVTRPATTSTPAATKASQTTSAEQEATTTAEGQSSPSQTPAGSSSSSSSNNDGVGRLSAGKIALISCVASIVGVIVAIIACCCCRK
jgi:hypothetical protein